MLYTLEMKMGRHNLPTHLKVIYRGSILSYSFTYAENIGTGNWHVASGIVLKVISLSIPVGTRSQIPIQHLQIDRQTAQLFYLSLRRRGDAAARKDGMMRLPTISTVGKGCQDFGCFLLD